MIKRYVTPNFTLESRPGNFETQMVMQMLTPIVNTKALPNTFNFLKHASPSVLKTTCFNSENLPFYKEVRATEIGHLFEHLLLDYLCIAEVQDGKISSEHSGHTDWNWERDPWGKFYIYVDSTKDSLRCLKKATFQSISLLEKLLGI